MNLKVNHCLLALPGVQREDVKRVMSHPQARQRRGTPCGSRGGHADAASQALSQCDGYLTRMGVIKEAVDDTAGAAKTIAQQQLRCACSWRGAPRSLRSADMRRRVRASTAIARPWPARAPASCMACRCWTRASKTTKTTSRALRAAARLPRRCAEPTLLRCRRFMALSREPVPPSANPASSYKTSVVFSLAEGARLVACASQPRR